MKSPGQKLAIRQLEEIEKASNGIFEIFDVTEPSEERRQLSVTISVRCNGYKHNTNGIKFRFREKLRLDIPWSFPLQIPSANFTHNRYGDFPHVQWGNHICLHQAPEIEWHPSVGMFGFMERLHVWLEAGAAGQLDPDGVPLHPPVAYSVSSLNVVPTINAPKPEGVYWGGYVEIVSENGVFAELGRWLEHQEVLPEGRLASVILLPGNMPYEYPTTMFNLIMALRDRGIPINLLRLIIEVGILRSPKGKPAIFILGAAMRGIAGGARLQHLTGWVINAEQADIYRNIILTAESTGEKEQEEDVRFEHFCKWGSSTSVEWCNVMEQRPEVVERRDSKSSGNWWNDKTIAILGCGAIGNATANILARAGVKKLLIYDKSTVSPGILVRQDFRRADIGLNKALALKTNLKLIDKNILIDPYQFNLVHIFDHKDRMAELIQADAIIDATASTTVALGFENYFLSHPKTHPPFITMCLGHNADFGLMMLVNEKCRGMSTDLDRRTKLSFSNSFNGKRFQEEFWPTQPQRRQFFQPEPGCSNPTFRGSYADVMAITAQLSNLAADWLSQNSDRNLNRAYGIDLSIKNSSALPVRQIEFQWQDYYVLNDQINDFEVRVEPEAMNSILSWIRRSERVNGARVETGGLLFGEFDEFLKIIWINEVSGPPSDSLSSPSLFQCGTEGVNEMHVEKLQRTSGSVRFSGMWHTHPRGIPIPSYTDLIAMESLLTSKTDYLGQRFLMIIVGGNSVRPLISASVFERANYGS